MEFSADILNSITTLKKISKMVSFLGHYELAMRRNTQSELNQLTSGGAANEWLETIKWNLGSWGKRSMSMRVSTRWIDSNSRHPRGIADYPVGRCPFEIVTLSTHEWKSIEILPTIWSPETRAFASLKSHCRVSSKRDNCLNKSNAKGCEMMRPTRGDNLVPQSPFWISSSLLGLGCSVNQHMRNWAPQMPEFRSHEAWCRSLVELH